MEQILDGLKAYILENDKSFEALATKDVPLDAPKDVTIGQVDIIKQKSKVLVSLLPETQTPQEGYVEGSSADNAITVTFICRGYKIDILTRQMMRYAEAFKNICFNDNSLGGVCDDVEIQNVQYYLDAGIMDNQATAVEITILVNKSV